jgi:dimethylargininase
MKALVRKPSPRLEEGSVVHIERSAVDFELALRQWNDYVDALRDHGWDIIEVPEDDESPDGVFIEDAVLMYEHVAIVTRPGTPSRAAEPATVEPVVRSLGYDVHRIEAPGTLEGGDVLKVGSTIYVGLTGSTNAAGVEQVRATLEPAGATVIAVPVTKALHLKSAITALPDGTIIGWSDVVDDPSIFEKYLAMPEEPGAHVVLLGGTRLLISSAAPKSAELLASLGYEPVPVDVGEYEKLEGCVTCLSVRLRCVPTPICP